MDKTNIILILVVGVFFCLLMVGAIDNAIENTRTQQSCDKLGMKYYYTMDTKFCVDSLGNAHYVKFKCEGFLWEKECKAQLISIGDVRVR